MIRTKYIVYKFLKICIVVSLAGIGFLCCLSLYPQNETKVRIAEEIRTCNINKTPDGKWHLFVRRQTLQVVAENREAKLRKPTQKEAFKMCSRYLQGQHIP